LEGHTLPPTQVSVGAGVVGVVDVVGVVGVVDVVVFFSSPPIMSMAELDEQHTTTKINAPAIIAPWDIFIIYTDNKCKDQFKPFFWNLLSLV
jgi:hypothetical protein